MPRARSSNQTNRLHWEFLLRAVVLRGSLAGVIIQGSDLRLACHYCWYQQIVRFIISVFL